MVKKKKEFGIEDKTNWRTLVQKVTNVLVQNVHDCSGKYINLQTSLNS